MNFFKNPVFKVHSGIRKKNIHDFFEMFPKLKQARK